MIEVIVSLGILGICIICTASIVKSLINSNESRVTKDEVSESLYAICSEIKYNVSYKNMKDEVVNNKLTFKYNKNFLNDISNNSLLRMDRVGKDDEKIEIELLEDNEDYMIIKVRIIYKGLEEEQSILKSPWMEYV